MFLTTISPYLLAFCRVVIVIVFAVSSVSKAVDIARFRQTIRTFHLLPERLSSGAAILFLVSEFAVAVLAALGGSLLLFGFALAVGLLLLFCLALVSVLVRGIRTSCHCFGQATKQVSHLDIWRNIGFIVCALVGYITLIWTKNSQEPMDLVKWTLIGLAAGVFVMIWTQLAEIVQLF